MAKITAAMAKEWPFPGEAVTAAINKEVKKNKIEASVQAHKEVVARRAVPQLVAGVDFSNLHAAQAKLTKKIRSIK